MAKMLDRPHVARAKRVAKKIRRSLDDIDSAVALSQCQEASARMMGFGDWHALTKADGFALSPYDEDMADADLEDRRARQAQALVDALPILRALGDQAVLAVVVAARPTAFAPPRSLLEAAAEGLAADSIPDGFESLGPEGAAWDIADAAHNALERDPEEARRLAHAALAIDPDCIDAHELLGLLARDPAEAVACHRLSVTRARSLYAAGHRAWCSRNPSDDPKVFWEFIGARPYIRAHMNLGRALMRAAEDDALQRDVALAEAERVFGHLITVLPRHGSLVARERRMIARMVRGDAVGAAKDAGIMRRDYHRRRAIPDCWTAWTLAWADLAQGGGGTVAIAEALDACPFALPLLLDGGEEVPLMGHDGTGPRAAQCYVAETRHVWLGTPGALAALKPFRPVAVDRIEAAKRRFAANWGAALPPDRPKPVPLEWRL